MNAETVNDSRMYGWPETVHTEDGMMFSARFLTPLGLSVANNFVISPLKALWKAAVVISALDFAFLMGGGGSIFRYMSVERGPVLWGILLLFALWKLELRNSYFLTTLIFGCRLKVTVLPDYLKVKIRSAERTYHLSHELAFGLKKLELAQDETYKHSQQLILVVGQVRPILVVEVLGWSTAGYLVTNANMMLQLAGGRTVEEGDIDPTRVANDDFI